MTFHSGKGGTVTINGNEIPVISWRVNPTAEMVAFRNSKTNGHTLREATFKDISFSVVLDFDFDASPFSSPTSILPGATLTNTKLLLNGTANPTVAWTIPSAIVSSTPQDCPIDGKIGTSFDAAASSSTAGDFVAPGGSTF